MPKEKRRHHSPEEKLAVLRVVGRWLPSKSDGLGRRGHPHGADDRAIVEVVVADKRGRWGGHPFVPCVGSDADSMGIAPGGAAVNWHLRRPGSDATWRPPSSCAAATARRSSGSAGPAIAAIATAARAADCACDGSSS